MDLVPSVIVVLLLCSAPTSGVTNAAGEGEAILIRALDRINQRPESVLLYFYDSSQKSAFPFVVIEPTSSSSSSSAEEATTSSPSAPIQLGIELTVDPSIHDSSCGTLLEEGQDVRYVALPRSLWVGPDRLDIRCLKVEQCSSDGLARNLKCIFGAQLVASNAQLQQNVLKSLADKLERLRNVTNFRTTPRPGLENQEVSVSPLLAVEESTIPEAKFRMLDVMAEHFQKVDLSSDEEPMTAAKFHMLDLMVDHLRQVDVKGGEEGSTTPKAQFSVLDLMADHFKQVDADNNAEDSSNDLFDQIRIESLFNNRVKREIGDGDPVTSRRPYLTLGEFRDAMSSQRWHYLTNFILNVFILVLIVVVVISCYYWLRTATGLGNYDPRLGLLVSSPASNHRRRILGESEAIRQLVEARDGYRRLHQRAPEVDNLIDTFATSTHSTPQRPETTASVQSDQVSDAKICELSKAYESRLSTSTSSNSGGCVSSCGSSCRGDGVAGDSSTISEADSNSSQYSTVSGSSRNNSPVTPKLNLSTSHQ